MTKDQYLYDCLVALPKLYEIMMYKIMTRKRKKALHDALQDFANAHELNYEDVLLMGKRKMNLCSVFETANQIAEKKKDELGENDPTVIRIPDGVTTIPDSSFSGIFGKKITKVYIPKSVERIGHGAFWGCHQLQSVSFAEGSCLKQIDASCFGCCESLSDINVPAEAIVGVDAFIYSKYLTLLLMGEIPCPVNVFHSLEKNEKCYICTTRINEHTTECMDFLKITFLEEPNDLLGFAESFADNTERMKMIFDVVANSDNITWLMNKVVEITEKTGNMELRLEMLNYQRERGLFPRERVLEL